MNDKPILTVVDQFVSIPNESIKINCQDVKPKAKRGRPRKNNFETDLMQQKKNRNKYVIVNHENSNDKLDKKETKSILPIKKTYIVQLKIKKMDLEKLQTQMFVDSQISYCQKMRSSENDIDPSNYINLLPYDHSSSISRFNHNESFSPISSDFKTISRESETLNNLVPNIYQDIIIPVSPNHVPIHLFNDNSIDKESMACQNNHCRHTSKILLPSFNDTGKWPESSTYACWNCDSFFNGTPIGIPDRENDEQFHCYGNFCSFECAARYLAEHDQSLDFWNKYSLLCLLYQKVYNLSFGTKVSFAPPREALNKYGGSLSYDQYHQTKNANISVEIYKLPLIPVLFHIAEIKRSIDLNNICAHQSQNSNQVFSQKNIKYIHNQTNNNCN